MQNFIKKEVTQLTIIDWLTISLNKKLQLDSISYSHKISDYIVLEDFKNVVPNQFFKDFFKLYINKQFVGIVSATPLKPYIPANTIHLKFANYLLYTNLYFKYLEILKNEGFIYNHVVRLDIANDSVNSRIIEFCNSYMTKLQSNSLGSLKKLGKSILIEHRQTSEIQNNSYSIGNLSREKSLSIYNKSNELLKSKKDYIKQFWDANNLDYKNNYVTRVELRLHGTKSKNINIYKLNDSNYLNYILNKELKGYFQFTINRIDRKNNRDVTPIKFTSTYKTQPIEQTTYNKPVKSNRSDLTKLKILYNEVLEAEYTNLNKQPNNELIRRLEIHIKYNHLKEYFNKRKDFISNEFKENWNIQTDDFRQLEKRIHINI